MLQAFLGFGGQFQAGAGAAEIHIHDNRRRQALDHRGAERRDAVQRLGAEAEELQLLGQALGAVMVLQQHVDGFAQRRQEGLFQLVAVAQAGTRQTLHQTVDFGDQVAAQAPAIGVHRLQRLADALGQLGMLGLFEALGKAQQAQIGFTEL
ncbi:hypothetical protein D9M68_835280 [compost metagenome]